MRSRSNGAVGKAEAIVLSPGPARQTGGICLDLIAAARDSVPILGVCLGHQAIPAKHSAARWCAPCADARQDRPIHHTGTGIFSLPDNFEATRYRSLIVERASLPDAG